MRVSHQPSWINRPAECPNDVTDIRAGEIMQDARRANFQFLMDGLKQVELRPGWQLQYYESSISLGTKNRKHNIRVTLDYKIFHDRTMKSGNVRSDIFKCSNVDETLQRVIDIYMRPVQLQIVD